MPRTRDNGEKLICASCSRRRGEYLCDVDLYETRAPANVVHVCAPVVNMVRLESGHTVTVNTELEDQHGATLDEAFSRLEPAVAAWVKARAGHSEVRKSRYGSPTETRRTDTPCSQMRRANVVSRDQAVHPSSPGEA
jgi:hypothetical protein